MNKLKTTLLISLILISVTACGSGSVEGNSKTTTYDNSITTASEASESNSLALTAETGTSANESDIPFPLDLLSYRIDENEHIYVDLSTLKKTNDWKLFRQYFFGIWEGAFAFADKSEQEGLIIDDSRQSFIMRSSDIGLLDEFYEINGHVLAFHDRSQSGSTMYWIDTENPQTMYAAWGGTSETNAFWSRAEDGSTSSTPKIYTLTKSDAPLNEPEENFLSFFKLLEMSQDYEIGFDMLVNIEYENKEGTGKLYHDDWIQFYPVYLVSEEPDKLVLKTIVGNAYIPDEEVDVVYTLEKINGEWTRVLEFMPLTD